MCGAVTGMGHSQGKAQSPAREKRNLRCKERGGAISWAAILHIHWGFSHGRRKGAERHRKHTGRGREDRDAQL